MPYRVGGGIVYSLFLFKVLFFFTFFLKLNSHMWVVQLFDVVVGLKNL